MTNVDKKLETINQVTNVEEKVVLLKKLADEIVKQTCDLKIEVNLDFNAETYKNYIDENAIYDLLEEDEEGGLIDVDLNEELDKIFNAI